LRGVEWNVHNVGIGLAAVALAVMVVGHLAQEGQFSLRGLVQDLWANLGTELAGIALTILVIDALNARRTTDEEKKRLILQMGSPENGFAVEAVRMLRVRGWLEDGSLAGAHLWTANLAGADLSQASLPTAKLMKANLRGAHLMEANLQEASLAAAQLQQARLEHARLQGAWLSLANLEGASLHKAKLQGAHLDGAHLEGADLAGAAFDAATVLPDHTHWSPDTDMARFTDPTHPAFWRSDDPASPAHRG
jgi:hypothetical protein